jgi:hypothetical protein
VKKLIVILVFAYLTVVAVGYYSEPRQATEQTRIEWAGRVEIAQIQADLTRDTSAVHNMFGMLRCLVVVAGLAAIPLTWFAVVGVYGKRGGL